MLNALFYTLLTALVCAIFVAPAFFYRWLCWILHFPLGWIRRFFRWVNWEKLSTITLGVALILVTSLTAHAAWDVSPSPDSGLDKGIYEGLRIAFSVFEGDSAQFRDYVAASPLASRGTLWVWFLNACAVVLPIIIPISTVATAAILLWNRLPHHVPVFSRNWYIFSELNPNSIRMAKSINEKLEEEWDTGVFIFLRTRRGDQSPEILDDIRTLNYYFHPKTEDRFLIWPLRRFRRMRFFFLSETTDENFERMQEFLEAVKNKWLFCPLGKPRDDVFQQELYLLSETESAPMLIDHLRGLLKDSKCFQNTELRLLDRFRATSYDLLRNKSLVDHSQDGVLNILILGFGKIGREIFRTASHMGVIHDCKTTFTICDLEVRSKFQTHESLTAIWDALSRSMAFIDFLFKDAAYAAEKELRLICTRSINDNYNSSEIKKTNEDPPKLFIMPPYQIYVEKIILGPKVKAPDTWIPHLQLKLAEMWENYPESYGNHPIPKVRKSSISYRD